MGKEPKDTVDDVVLDTPMLEAPSDIRRSPGRIGGPGSMPSAQVPALGLPPLPEPFKGCRIITDASEAAAWKEAVMAHVVAKEEAVV